MGIEQWQMCIKRLCRVLNTTLYRPQRTGDAFPDFGDAEKHAALNSLADAFGDATSSLTWSLPSKGRRRDLREE
jgi:hypothetical protein